MDLFEAINGRRSVRKFTEEPIDKEDLAKIIDAGKMAPSWANTQCQEIVLVRDQATKEKLAQTLSQQNPARNATVAAPLVMVACGKKKRAGFKGGDETTILGDWLMFDVALFMGNVTLAAHALGYGTVHVGLFDHNLVAEILGVPDDVQVVEIVPLGRPASEPKKAPPRRDPGDFVHEENFLRHK